MNMLSLMSRSSQVHFRKRPFALPGPPGGAPAPAAEVEAQHAENVDTNPTLSILLRKAAQVLLAVLVITYFIVAFGIAQMKAAWPQERAPHTKG
jgi:hypothetical protein